MLWSLLRPALATLGQRPWVRIGFLWKPYRVLESTEKDPYLRPYTALEAPRGGSTGTDRILFLLTLSPVSQESLPAFFLVPGACAQPERGLWVGQPGESWEAPQDLSLPL